jgi:hypothetical protein
VAGLKAVKHLKTAIRNKRIPFVVRGGGGVLLLYDGAIPHPAAATVEAPRQRKFELGSLSLTHTHTHTHTYIHSSI